MSLPNSSTIPPLVRHLLSLPRELVHLVLDDLPISRILLLSLLKLPYIDECILSHLHYMRLFRTNNELYKVCDYFQLYATILTARSLSAHTFSIQLSLHPASSQIAYDELVSHLHILIVFLIDKSTPLEQDLDVLSTLSQISLRAIWDSSDISFLRLRWTTMETLIKTVNMHKSEQISQLHVLFTTHPKILKVELDPSQEPRSNITHILARMKWLSEQLERPKYGLGGKKTHTFSYGLPVVPYDLYLRLFLKVLERYPLPDEDMPTVTSPIGKAKRGGFPTRILIMPQQPCEGQEQPSKSTKETPQKSLRVSRQGRNSTTYTFSFERSPPVEEKTVEKRLLHGPKLTEAQVKAQSDHNYTPSAIENIRKAVLGLTYVYTSTSTSFVPPRPAARPNSCKLSNPTKNRILRTKHTPYSAYPYNFSSGFGQPCFVLRETVEESFAPLPAMELQWLEAFLWSCDYMENMHDARWNEDMSVADMWNQRSQYTN